MEGRLPSSPPNFGSPSNSEGSFYWSRLGWRTGSSFPFSFLTEGLEISKLSSRSRHSCWGSMHPVRTGSKEVLPTRRNGEGRVLFYVLS